MRRICWLLPALLLAACGGQEDMDSYVAQTKARPPIPIEPLPELKPFAPKHYQQRELHSPFMVPQPEATVGSTSTAKAQPDCAQTLMDREKEVLENYSLASLSMHGSLGKAGQLWALIHCRGFAGNHSGREGVLGNKRNPVGHGQCARKTIIRDEQQ